MRTFIVIVALFVALPCFAADVLLSEGFEDNGFLSRSWYDAPEVYTIPVVSSGYSGNCLQLTFSNGGTNPTQFATGSLRKLFTASDTIYIDYYIKFPAGWQEQSGGYGHHEMLITTDVDTNEDPYTSLAFAHGMGYIEHWGTSGSSTSLTPHMTFQDGANINQSQIDVDLTATTENRSVAGCNGLLDSSFFDYINCYDSGSGTYWNGKLKAGTSQSMSLNAWHHVQAYFKMNSISGGKGIADGTMAYWLDGVQQFRSDAVLFRTNQNATMKFNQIAIAPFMGNGSPQSQSFYIDNLNIYDGIPVTAVGSMGGISASGVTFR